MPSFKLKERKSVNLCYDHLGGELGEKLFNFFIEKQWIVKALEGRDYDITDTGKQGLEALGIDLQELYHSKRKVLSPCIERFCGTYVEHTGAHLGTLLARRLFALGWTVQPGEKQAEITAKGYEELHKLGVV